MLKEKSSNPVELQNLNKIQISLKEQCNINISKNVCWVDFIDFFSNVQWRAIQTALLTVYDIK